MTHDPYAVHPRKVLTPKQKLKMFVAHDGICCVCGLKINGVKEAWDEHDDPLWLNGTNETNNRKPSHVRCARAKSADETTIRNKIQRVAERHFGAKKSKNQMPGSRNSKWKKKMDGTVVKR